MAITEVVSFEENPKGGMTFKVVQRSCTGRKYPYVLNISKVDRGLMYIQLDSDRSLERTCKAIAGTFEYESNFKEEVRRAFHYRGDYYLWGFCVRYRGVTFFASPSMVDERTIYEQWEKARKAVAEKHAEKTCDTGDNITKSASD